MIRGTGYGAGLSDCLKKLEESISQFNVEVAWCNSKRLGEVHQNGIDALATVKITQDGVEDVKKGRGSFSHERKGLSVNIH